MKLNQKAPNSDGKVMSSNLKKIREALGLTTYYMAEQLGISQPTYFLMEKEGYTFHTREKEISGILGIPAGEIWPYEGDKTPKLDKLLETSGKLSEFNAALEQVLKVITDLKQNNSTDLEKMRKQAISQVRGLLDILGE